MSNNDLVFIRFFGLGDFGSRLSPARSMRAWTSSKDIAKLESLVGNQYVMDQSLREGFNLKNCKHDFIFELI